MFGISARGLSPTHANPLFSLGYRILPELSDNITLVVLHRWGFRLLTFLIATCLNHLLSLPKLDTPSPQQRAFMDCFGSGETVQSDAHPGIYYANVISSKPYTETVSPQSFTSGQAGDCEQIKAIMQQTSPASSTFGAEDCF